MAQHYELRRESRMDSVKQDLKSNQLMQRVSRASKLIGTPVKSPNEDILGEVFDLVLDPETGQVAYVVMTSGGITNKGAKFFAIPWKALYWADHKYHYVLDLDKSILTSSPGFNPNHWPNSYDKGDIQREGLKQFYYSHP